MSDRFSFSKILRHFWPRKSAGTIPFQISPADFPGGIYDPDYDFIRLFGGQVERGAALALVGVLEQAISQAVKGALVQDEKLHSVMFQDSGALGALGTKVRLGYLLSLYSKETMNDLERICKIRNQFAHNPEAKNFMFQRVRDHTNLLSLFTRAKANDDVLIVAAREKIEKLFSSKDLTKEYFQFFMNVTLIITYLSVQMSVRKKLGDVALKNFSIF
jgi:DNA-binding MltR family transcriptional regulator